MESFYGLSQRYKNIEEVLLFLLDITLSQGIKVNYSESINNKFITAYTQKLYDYLWGNGVEDSIASTETPLFSHYKVIRRAPNEVGLFSSFKDLKKYYNIMKKELGFDDSFIQEDTSSIDCKNMFHY